VETSTVIFLWLLVTLFPLSDGGVCCMLIVSYMAAAGGLMPLHAFAATTRLCCHYMPLSPLHAFVATACLCCWLVYGAGAGSWQRADAAGGGVGCMADSQMNCWCMQVAGARTSATPMHGQLLAVANKKCDMHCNTDAECTQSSTHPVHFPWVDCLPDLFS
jgi:hypothetical protein